MFLSFKKPSAKTPTADKQPAVSSQQQSPVVVSVSADSGGGAPPSIPRVPSGYDASPAPMPTAVASRRRTSEQDAALNALTSWTSNISPLLSTKDTEHLQPLALSVEKCNKDIMKRVVTAYTKKEELASMIASDEVEHEKLTESLKIVNARVQQLEQEMQQKVSAIAELDRVIQETESAYQVILQGSRNLLEILDNEAGALKAAKADVYSP